MSDDPDAENSIWLYAAVVIPCLVLFWKRGYNNSLVDSEAFVFLVPLLIALMIDWIRWVSRSSSGETVIQRVVPGVLLVVYPIVILAFSIRMLIVSSSAATEHAWWGRHVVFWVGLVFTIGLHEIFTDSKSKELVSKVNSSATAEE